MKLSPLTLLTLILPPRLLSQDTLAAAPEVMIEDDPPPGLAAVELARSRRCVPLLARVDTLDQQLLPLALRAERILLLEQAVSLEDSTRAVPFAAADPVEVAVRAWFAADLELARQYVAGGDDAIQKQRDQGREQIRQRLAEARAAVNAQAQAAVAATGDLMEAAGECQNVILIRDAVVEACGAAVTPLCIAARAPGSSGEFPFVDAPENIWDVSSFRAWQPPARLGVGAQGGFAGAQTSAMTRVGNLTLVLSVGPMVRNRSTMPAEELAPIQVNLDSLGFTFTHPTYLIAPALTIDFEVIEPLGGETHYFLHFGDLSVPARDVIWTTPAGVGGPVTAVLPATKSVLDRLAAGDPVALTAVRFAKTGAKEGEAVYNLELPDVGQADAVTALVGYFTGGQLGEDFSALLPPETR